MKNYTPIIGLEIHIEQNTETKMFCNCSAHHFAVAPNTNTCPTCLALPGALPFANGIAIENTIKFGLAIGCEIAKFSKFDRKHYVYPDLPKSYQISQYDLPLCGPGTWTIESGQVVGIRRIHLEEDTAKMQHAEIHGNKVSLVDFNRGGVPLIEMVTEPDFHDVESVDLFLKEMQLLVRYLGISTADMEKGSMRLEANISMSEDGVTLPSYKVELKNINSFRFLKKALASEIERQTEALNMGVTLIQETRGFDEKSGKTYSQRIKEDAHDYRYFPDPDLPPLTFTEKDIDTIRQNLPELPHIKRARMVRDYGISLDFARTLITDRSRAEYFERALEAASGTSVTAKVLADSMVNQKLDEKYPEPSGLVKYLYELTQVSYASEAEVDVAVQEVISSELDAVSKFKSGKEEIIGFLVGQVQKRLRGKGEVSKVISSLRKALTS